MRKQNSGEDTARAIDLWKVVGHEKLNRNWTDKINWTEHRKCEVNANYIFDEGMSVLLWSTNS